MFPFDDVIMTWWDRDKIAAMFADGISKCIFLNEKFPIANKISLSYTCYGPADNDLALVQV